MKKLFICFLLLLSLTACTQAKTPVSSTPQAPSEAVSDTPAPESADQTAFSEDRNPTAAELGREEATDLTFILEGQEEIMPAALYIGQGYSMYIPTEGWERESSVENGVPADSWKNSDNSAVELRVLHLGEQSREDCREWIGRNFDRYVLSEDKRGDLYGEDAEKGELLEVRFHESGEAVYAVMWAYPMEAAEGFGTRLSVMADTFEVMS